MEKIPRITEPSVSDVKLFRDFWMYCIIMGFSEAQKGEAMPPPSSHVSDVCWTMLFPINEWLVSLIWPICSDKDFDRRE